CPRPSRLGQSPVRALDFVGEDRTVLQDDHPLTHPLADSLDPKRLWISYLGLNDWVFGAVQVATDHLPPLVRLSLRALDNREVLLSLPVPEKEKPARPLRASDPVDLYNFAVVVLVGVNLISFVVFPEMVRAVAELIIASVRRHWLCRLMRPGARGEAQKEKEASGRRHDGTRRTHRNPSTTGLHASSRLGGPMPVDVLSSDMLSHSRHGGQKKWGGQEFALRDRTAACVTHARHGADTHSLPNSRSTTQHPLTCGPGPRRCDRMSALSQPASSRASAKTARRSGSR